MAAGEPASAAPRRPLGGAWLWLVPVAVLLAAVGYAAVRRQAPESITRALARGARPAAPAFTLPRLDGGGTLSLVELRGRAVVLNFWASWCVPCREEAPLLERLWREYRDRGLVVVGVNIQDLEREARRFVAVTQATYPQVRDRDGSTPRAYGLTGVPETFFIDREGRIRRKFSGAVVEWAAWREAVEALLAAP